MYESVGIGMLMEMEGYAWWRVLKMYHRPQGPAVRAIGGSMQLQVPSTSNRLKSCRPKATRLEWLIYLTYLLQRLSSAKLGLLAPAPIGVMDCWQVPDHQIARFAMYDTMSVITRSGSWLPTFLIGLNEPVIVKCYKTISSILPIRYNHIDWLYSITPQLLSVQCKIEPFSCKEIDLVGREKLVKCIVEQ